MRHTIEIKRRNYGNAYVSKKVNGTKQDTLRDKIH